MYALGHYGVALLVYAPVGFLLARTEPTLALVGGAGVLALSTVPDYDLRLPFVSHRGITHTLVFALAVSGALGAVGWRLGQGSYAPLGGPVESAAFAFGVGMVGLGSHVLGDVLTPAGVAVLWPLSDHEYTVSLTRADNTLANWGLFALGVLAAAAALTLAVRV
ncbi:metal-dependent hydrolase [Halosegnis marinus]|uniref:Metal-dependent hydrolase n=1 Tax=Halosegnis marinus TaxID=3034023 RepID=A0ABD5ZKT3_9EURY|nr:metal-dependent hydrolase [Halosegnis sp. DT85]